MIFLRFKFPLVLVNIRVWLSMVILRKCSAQKVVNERWVEKISRDFQESKFVLDGVRRN